MEAPPTKKSHWIDLLLATLIGGVGLMGLLLVTGDPIYWLSEHAPNSTFRTYDQLIADAAKRHNLPPEFVKALIWQESRFGADKVGLAGEYGLMQVTEIASRDWVTAKKIPNFNPKDLFDPQTNLEVGTWYLARALGRYQKHDDPHPFALAEYNAGRSRVNRWMSTGTNELTDANELRALIDFPSTRSYLENILARQEFYKRRGEFTP